MPVLSNPRHERRLPFATFIVEHEGGTSLVGPDWGAILAATVIAVVLIIVGGVWFGLSVN